MTRYDTPRGDAGLEVNTAVVTPTDRIRWGPILAGVFAALTAAAVLSTLGAAVGMSAYDRNDDARTFAIGAGIWGIITMLVAYCLGGWVTARSTAVRGRNNGLLNGIMVAAVGIPLMLFMLGRAGAAAGREAMESRQSGQGQQASSGSGGVAGGFDGAAQASGTLTPGDQSAAGGRPGGSGGGGGVTSEDAARAGSRAAWGTLIALLLAIGASAVGGYMGARDPDRDRDRGQVATA